MLRLGLVAGEASGDNLGAGLMTAMQDQGVDVQFIGVGGEHMCAAGLDSVFALEELSVNGFREPMLKLPALLKRYRQLVQVMSEAQLDAFLGIDFNVFNFLLEGALKKRDIKTAHYVSPSVYAWRRGRTRRVAKVADMVMCLFPFEPEFYSETPIEAVFVGHPLADKIDFSDSGEAQRQAARANLGLHSDALVLALLPGSRSSEVSLMLPDFLAAADLFARACTTRGERCQIVIPCLRETIKQQVQAALQAYPDLEVTCDQAVATQSLTAANIALVKSGTSTLEAMLLHRPMVVSYRLGGFTYQVVKRMMNSPYVALPNILAGRMLVPELLQYQANPHTLAAALSEELAASKKVDYLKPFLTLHEDLRQQADATAARAMLRLMGVGDR